MRQLSDRLKSILLVPAAALAAIRSPNRSRATRHSSTVATGHLSRYSIESFGTLPHSGGDRPVALHHHSCPEAQLTVHPSGEKGNRRYAAGCVAGVLGDGARVDRGISR